MKAYFLGLLGAVTMVCPVYAAPGDAMDRATMAAERAAQAAERSAAAAERAAAALERANPAPPPPAADAPAVLLPPPNPWTFQAGVGLISLTGNATVITATANVATQYKSERFLLNLNANGAYGQSMAVLGTPAQVTALNALFQGKAGYRFSDKISGYLAAGVDTDHVKSVEVRGFGEVGMSVLWLDRKEGDLQKLYLNTDLGFRYQRENRFQYYTVLLDVPDVDMLAPRAAGQFKYALNKEVFFYQDIEIVPNVLGQARVLINTMTKVSAHLVSVLSVSASFAVKYDSRPAAGRVPTDTALTVGFDAAF